MLAEEAKRGKQSPGILLPDNGSGIRGSDSYLIFKLLICNCLRVCYSVRLDVVFTGN
jgi:hypothetical protein